MENSNIKELIVKTTPPFEWDIKGHPIKELGYYFYAIYGGFKFDEAKVDKADDIVLWKLYALINEYWLKNYEQWNARSENMVFNMRNKIIISEKDIGKDMLSIYEEHFKWQF